MNKLLLSDNRPTQELLELLALLNVKNDRTLASIVHATQKEWLNIELKQKIDEIYISHANKIMEYADKLGLIQEIKPKQKNFTYAIILGSDLNETRLRLAYLVNEWKKGIIFNRLICLGSERPLDPRTESKDNLLNSDNGILLLKKNWLVPANLPKTEDQMMQWVYNQSELPEKFQELPISFSNSKMRKQNDRLMAQPNTADTIQDWLNSNPIPGDCLFISNQPFIGYQESVIKTFMPSGFGHIEVCGPTQSNINFKDILDTLARFLYQEKMRREKLI